MATAARHNFTQVLINTFIANITTTFLWQAVTFWMYLETRNVMVTAILGGSYVLGAAVFGVPFGTWIDRTRKRQVMVSAQAITAVFYLLATIGYLITPREVLLTLGSWQFLLFLLLLLIGGIMESARGIALSTVVTLLVPDEDRAKANGLVGMVNGISFLLTLLIAGLAVGQLGMTVSLGISLALTVVSLGHMLSVPIPEPEIVHADGAPRKVDFRGAWVAIRAVPGLIWLVVFSTFNNLLGGVFMALLDPYGLELVSVEIWGVIYGGTGIGFLIGGSLLARFGLGAKPLRALLLLNLGAWIIGILMGIRASLALLIICMFAYMVIIPVVEAAEQTVLQRVVPLHAQGRVFGFAQSIELAASPISSFLAGPLAQIWLIPFMNTSAGRETFGWLLGTGPGRGIALVFVIASLIGLTLTFFALASRPYRVLSKAYADAAPGKLENGPALQ